MTFIHKNDNIKHTLIGFVFIVSSVLHVIGGYYDLSYGII